MKKLPKEVYLHTFIMILLLVSLVTALITYVLIVAPIEYNQKQIIKTVNGLIKECEYSLNTPEYNQLLDISFNFSMDANGEHR